MQNKVILITGATDGIGKATAKEFAKKEATIIVHGRESARVQSTVSEIISQTGNSKIFGVTADFSSFKQVVEMANELNSKFDKIDLFYNNAGLFSHERVITEDNNELCFQVNHLSAQLLTLKIQDLLKNNENSRIIL